MSLLMPQRLHRTSKEIIWPPEGRVFHKYITSDGPDLTVLCRGNGCVNLDKFLGCEPGTLRIALEHTLEDDQWHLMYRTYYQPQGWNLAIHENGRSFFRLCRSIDFADELGLKAEDVQSRKPT